MLADWQQHIDDTRKERVRQLGLLTGLRRDKEGGFRPANFERALVLQRLVALHRPTRVLELGTGRGLGCLAIADAARELGTACEITSVDILPPTQPQDWPIELNGQAREGRACIDEIWLQHIDSELRRRVRLRTGPTTKVLPALAQEGAQFDLIFIDAGHDLFSVAHDLSYSAALLAEGGCILMDDFAPMEEFGLGTCIVLGHARRWFAHVEVLTTEGAVYGGAVHPEAPRGMVFLKELRARQPRIRRSLLAWWRFASAVLERCCRPETFPLGQPPRGA
jgi:predicted O-methyltransferase YrrM